MHRIASIMIHIEVSKTRIVGITSLAAIFPATALMSASFAYTPKAEYLLSVSETCNNLSFCGGERFTYTAQATAYADHQQTTQIYEEIWSASGHVELIQYTTWVGPWWIGSGYDFFTAGTNTTTVVQNGHSTATIQYFSNYDTGTSAKPGTLDCFQVVMSDTAPCPPGVSGSQTVVKV
jgi:hypothetical protein